MVAEEQGMKMRVGMGVQRRRKWLSCFCQIVSCVLSRRASWDPPRRPLLTGSPPRPVGPPPPACVVAVVATVLLGVAAELARVPLQRLQQPSFLANRSSDLRRDEFQQRCSQKAMSYAAHAICRPLPSTITLLFLNSIDACADRRQPLLTVLQPLAALASPHLRQNGLKTYQHSIHYSVLVRHVALLAANLRKFKNQKSKNARIITSVSCSCALLQSPKPPMRRHTGCSSSSANSSTYSRESTTLRGLPAYATLMLRFAMKLCRLMPLLTVQQV